MSNTYTSKDALYTKQNQVRSMHKVSTHVLCNNN